MIRLVITSDLSSTMTRCFDQSIVTIGSDASPYADLSLPGEILEERHLQIIKEQNRFFAINLVNDPFITLNGLPFGKKPLKHQDVIQIGNSIIRFELVSSENAAETLQSWPISQNAGNKDISDLVDTKEILPIIVEEAMAGQAVDPLNILPSGIGDLRNDEIEQLINENPYSEWSEEVVDQTFDDFPESGQPLDISGQPLDIDDLVRQMEELAESDEILSPLENNPAHAKQDVKAMPGGMPSDQDSLVPSPHNALQPQEQLRHPLAMRLAAATLDAADTPASSTIPSTPLTTTGSIPKLSLKDYYLSEYDDRSEQNAAASSEPASSLPKITLAAKNWRIYIKIFVALLGITAIGAALIFLWMSDQSDKEEINAAKGVADVAMALNYAQIKHIQPQNQNWSDPEFIKNNLTAVIASRYTSLADFDAHGQFTNCPYMLRIYTSSDLSQFLVIAQPAPSLLQWLIPKTSIIIDSRAMEMRKIKDLKSLNRLLVNANTLDGSNAAEVSNLIRQGGLIPLINLVIKGENQGFSPPKALSLLRPGAENLVYNAPRYYPLGEEPMKKSLDLLEKPASSHEVAMLQQELSSLGKLPNLILYSSSGIQNAIQSQKALSTLYPKEKFLIAYLQLNSKGHVVNSHLVMDETTQDIAISDNNRNAVTKLTTDNAQRLTGAPEGIISGEKNEGGAASSESYNDIDEDNPLFLQLSALNVFRQQALRPICEEITFLLNKETQSAQPNFTSRHQQLLDKYLEIRGEQQAKMTKKLDAIYRENTHLIASEFFNLAKAANLEESLRDYLAALKQQKAVPEYTQEMMDKRLQAIEKATSWQSLEQVVSDTVEFLHLERIPDEHRIIAYQNATRSRVIQKLNQFLLSPEHPLPPQAFDPEYRYTLTHILKMSWVTDIDTCDFYLSEFDLKTIPRGQIDEEQEGDDGE